MLSGTSAAVQQPSRFVVYEYFAGDTNVDGQVMALNSSATYYFTDHFSTRAGIPIYFDRVPSTLASSTAIPSTFSSGIGDIFLTLPSLVENADYELCHWTNGNAPRWVDIERL